MGDELVEFKIGKVVCGRWKVMEKLGAGGCGAVYEVADPNRLRYRAALKVESNNIEDGGVLKLEAEVLKKLSSRKKCIRLLHAGKRKSYSFIVMTLCGPDLMFLKRVDTDKKSMFKHSDNRFSVETTVRIGVHALYAIKQLHEIGYVHRDVKPGNMVIGVSGYDTRIIFMIDYGMVRSFIMQGPDGKLTLRKARNKVLLRGTLRYCSLQVHERKEQGRVDDLWSLMYMLVELLVGLPWSKETEESPLKDIKMNTSCEKLFEKCPPEFNKITDHLKELTYEKRPNYRLIYDAFTSAMKRLNVNFSMPYDWEEKVDTGDFSALSITEGRTVKNNKKPTHEEYEWKCYPTTNPKAFDEKSLEI
ncbi:unnamed protein product [Bursaphelenchus xylophilus]|uniref:non-specific serine/threonine protein kinase n=1 Tax=Bursaphelenchus xylophilus TaxID=6326 RepID=A0A1I7RNJ0_BURXY|nr:unnamed protein product [Bursaphelenchus xylophilus]CAG9124069.1 unnamed protein product [Bursaphelenchus xylophilus]